MKLRQLKTFYWVTQLGSFAATAEKLGTTQSTISTRIHELEVALGVVLFDRSRRTARLTTKGQELIPYAEQFLRLIAEVEECVATPESVSGVVRIGVTEVVALTWLPTFLRALHERYPKIVPLFDVSLNIDLLQRLERGYIDLAVGLAQTIGTDLVAHSLGRVEFKVMASPALSIGPEPVTRESLAGFSLITLPVEGHLSPNFDHWTRQDSYCFSRIDTCNSLSTVANLTASGLGVSLLPPRCFTRHLETNALRILDSEPEPGSLEFFAVLRVDSLGAMLKTVVALVRELSDFD